VHNPSLTAGYCQRSARFLEVEFDFIFNKCLGASGGAFFSDIIGVWWRSIAHWFT
jgi:hypothetical protein